MKKKFTVCMNSYLVYGLILMNESTFENWPIFKFFLLMGRFYDRGFLVHGVDDY